MAGSSVQDLKIRLTVENGKAKATIDQTKSSFKAMTDTVQDGAHGANEALDQLSEKVEQLGHHFEALETLGKVFLTFEGLKHLVESLTETNIEFQQLHYTLLAATGSTEGAAREMDFLWGVADRLGTKMETMAHIYGTYANAAKQAGVDSAVARKVFESVAEAGTVFHLSTDQMTSAMLALDQMMGEGIITSQNLRLQLGQALPGAYEAFVRIVNSKGIDFKKVIKGGGLDVKTFLPDLGKAISETYNADALAQSTKGLNAELGRLSNAILKVKRDFSGGAFADALTPLVTQAGEAINAFDKLSGAVGGTITVWAATAGAIVITSKGIGKLLELTAQYSKAFVDAARAEAAASATRLQRQEQEVQAAAAAAAQRAVEAEQLQLQATLYARSAEAKQAQLVVEEKQAELQVERIRGNASLQGSTEALAAAEANLARIRAEQQTTAAEVTQAQAAETAAIQQNTAAKTALSEANGTAAESETAVAEATTTAAAAHNENTTALQREAVATAEAGAAAEGLAAKQGLAATAAGAATVAARGLVGVLGGLPGIIGLAVVALGVLIVKSFQTSDALKNLEQQAQRTKEGIASLAKVQQAVGVAQGELNKALAASGGKETDVVLQKRADLAAAIRASASSAADYAARDLDLEQQIGAAKEDTVNSWKKVNALQAEYNKLAEESRFNPIAAVANVQRMEVLQRDINVATREMIGAHTVWKESEKDLTANSVANSAARRSAMAAETQQEVANQRTMATAEAERYKKEADDAKKKMEMDRANTAEAIKLQQQVNLASFQKKGGYAVDKATGRAVDPTIRAQEEEMLKATAEEVTAERAKADAAKATSAAKHAESQATKEQTAAERDHAKQLREGIALDSEEQAGLRRLNDIEDQANKATQNALPWDQKHDAAMQQLTDTYNQLIQALRAKLALDPKNLDLQKQVTEAALEYDAAVERAATALDNQRLAEERLAKAQLARQLANTTAQNKLSAAQLHGNPVDIANAQRGVDQTAAQDQLEESLNQLNATGKPGEAAYEAQLSQILLQYKLATQKITDTWDEATGTMRGVTLQLRDYMQNNLGNFIEMALSGNFKGIADAWKQMLVKMVADFLSKKILDLIDQMTNKVNNLNSAMQKTGSGSSGGSGFWGTVFSLIGSWFGGGGHAEGGPITGPGTGTSDSIPARLSNGEFVVRADAVKRYGVNFLSALNNMVLPAAPSMKFATGGLVGGGGSNVMSGDYDAGTGTIVNVNNYSSEPAEVRRHKTPSGQEQIDIIVGKVAQSVRDNGVVGQAIQGTFGVGRRGRV